MRSIIILLLLLTMLTPGLSDPIDTAIADFGYRYLHSSEEKEEDIVFSPLSLHAAFSMLTMGAQGETRREALEALHLSGEFEKPYSVFLKTLTTQNKGLHLASKIWPSRSVTLKESFVSLCKATFDAEPESLDYNNTAEARGIINSWVSKRTNAMIPELLPLGSIVPHTQMVLTNALYFKGTWVNSFADISQKDVTFQSPSGPTKVTMMSGTHPALHHETSDYDVICLPYKDSTLAMAIILPTELEGWRTLGPQISSDMLKLADTKDEDHPSLGKIFLELPRFAIRQTSQPLVQLAEMGMGPILGLGADFGAMTNGQLEVSDCFHEAVVEVDEKGTEAAAATAILMTRSASLRPKSIKVDRPFFFVIYEREAFAPLFIGRVLNPQEAASKK